MSILDKKNFGSTKLTLREIMNRDKKKMDKEAEALTGLLRGDTASKYESMPKGAKDALTKDVIDTEPLRDKIDKQYKPRLL